MSSREGRGRPHRDYPLRSEDKSHHRGGSNPPSRHLWVGNLSHNLTESGLVHYFVQFGELESVAFQPGRSYAFINYRNDRHAFAAMEELQGFAVGGKPLRLEYAKAEKALLPRDAAYSQGRNDPYPVRESSFPERASRARRSSPEPPYPNKSKMNDNNAEPSEVLWIGFPAQLKVDEFILRKAFSPFGEIEKITAFPGRTYAFVRFRNVMAACRAKETLHGKLFGNPRVHICFANNESGTTNRQRNPIDDSLSPRGGSYVRPRSSDRFQSDRNIRIMSEDTRIRSPSFVPNLDPDDPDVIGMARKNYWPGDNDAHDRRRFSAQGSQLGFHENMYELPRSPSRVMDSHFREFSPEKFPRQGPVYDDDPWDLPEDVSLFHGSKKLKTESFPPEELPEYPFSDLGKVKHVLPNDNPPSWVPDKKFDSRTPGYRSLSDHSLNQTQPFGERGNNLNASHDNFQVGSIPLHPHDQRRLTPDLHETSPKEVWKWEGMISKGGTPVCRARCFPVGKPLDNILPEYINCTARTSLDMLAKHYYQSSSAWVVFFAPANDPDIAYYNDFMNHLGEKQRAAVAKLDEKTTLFLVPPSEFSEKVLKVPGRLSISGVVLKLDPLASSSYAPLPQNENKKAFFQSDASYQPSISPSGSYFPTPLNNHEKPMMNAAVPSHGNYSSDAPPAIRSLSNTQPKDGQRQDYVQKPATLTNWSIQDLQNSNFNVKNNVTAQASSSSFGSMGHTYGGVPRPSREEAYTPQMSGTPSRGNVMPPVQEKPPVPSSMPLPGLPSEQLAQLASSLFAQHGQFGNVSTGGEHRQSADGNQPYSSIASHNYGFANDQVPPQFAPPGFGQSQTQQVQPPPREVPAATQVNQQLQNTVQDNTEADPQKRLQATLQLAAQLLQQIQQGKGT